MSDSSDRVTRRDGLVIVHGTTGVDYIVTTQDSLDENLRTCNVDADRDLLLDARSYLESGVGFPEGSEKTHD